MIPGCLDLMKPMGREMQIAAKRIRDWLRFVMIVQAGEIPPARVAAQFDEAGADHDAKTEPAKKPDDKQRRPAFRKWPAIEQRTEKDRQEPGLEQLDFPAVTVPNLADVDDRHVHHPQNRENDRVRVSGKNNERQSETYPRKDRQQIIGKSEPKQRRNAPHTFGRRTYLRLNGGEKMIRRGQSMFTDKRD